MTFTWTSSYQSLVENPILTIIFALAAYRLTRLLIEDVATEPIRDFVWKRRPVTTKIGYLFTCYWCMGMWVAGSWFIFWGIVPEVALVLSLILSISAFIGLISAWTER